MLSIDGRNRAIVIAESLARVIAAIRIVVFVGDHISPPPKTQKLVLKDPARSLRCSSNRAIGVHWCSRRSTWNCGMACESWPRSLNASDWQLASWPI